MDGFALWGEWDERMRVGAYRWCGGGENEGHLMVTNLAWGQAGSQPFPRPLATHYACDAVNSLHLAIFVMAVETLTWCSNLYTRNT